ncbi:MAG: tryptophan synthase subunit beta [Alphaproteobacteria bacterium]|nr:tryptophan synthase subunit beta [Alphaproteobacteria bacterium]MCB9698556.1 tryptophan synthase subunit beta [Alphaproteobacteria bacterium]
MREQGRFGRFGGFYVAEPLIPALEELEAAWHEARDDAAFQAELRGLLAHWAGRPTPLYRSPALSAAMGCNAWLKREDLLHGGAHKTNNTVGQGLLARRMGRRRLVAETGAGQHGVATAMVGALLGMEVTVFMGATDVARQAPNVARMELFGARVVPVTGGRASLKEAINEALRYWTEHVRDTFYVFGTAAGPHPYPTIVAGLQRVIGEEIREQLGRDPAAIYACVGGGSNAIGAFGAFLERPAVALIGVEPGGHGLDSGLHGATLGAGREGCLHGSVSLVLQDDVGQIEEAYSVSAGLDYPGVGPQHAHLRATGRATYESVTDDEALDALRWLCRAEGILPALESAHAVAAARRAVGRHAPDDDVVVNLSGRGDKDLAHVMGERRAPHVQVPVAPATLPPAEAALPRAARGTRAFPEAAARAKAEGRGLVVPFLVLGDPGPEASVALCRALVDGGADALELGLPFSDPPADGPVIQAADQRALAAGTTPELALGLVARVRAFTDVPVSLLVYFNLVLSYGVERFYADAAAAGVDAVLVADLPPEHAEQAVAAARAAGVAPVFLASELSTPARLARIARDAEGYVYALARIGTTGERAEVAPTLGPALARMREAFDLPLLVGFGISGPEQARAALDAGADGVIVGSALVRLVERFGAEAGPHLTERVRELTAAAHRS